MKFLLFILLLCGCTSILERKMLNNAVEKGLPSTCFWNGGKDGGEWVNLVFEDSIFHIDTYNEHTLEFNKRFSFQNKCDNLTKQQVKKAFKFTNGVYVIWDEKCDFKSCIENL